MSMNHVTDALDDLGVSDIFPNRSSQSHAQHYEQHNEYYMGENKLMVDPIRPPQDLVHYIHKIAPDLHDEIVERIAYFALQQAASYGHQQYDLGFKAGERAHKERIIRALDLGV